MPLLFQHKIGHYFKGADKEARNEKLKLRVFICQILMHFARIFYPAHKYLPSQKLEDISKVPKRNFCRLLEYILPLMIFFKW